MSTINDNSSTHLNNVSDTILPQIYVKRVKIRKQLHNLLQGNQYAYPNQKKLHELKLIIRKAENQRSISPPAVDDSKKEKPYVIDPDYDISIHITKRPQIEISSRLLNFTSPKTSRYLSVTTTKKEDFKSISKCSIECRNFSNLDIKFANSLRGYGNTSAVQSVRCSSITERVNPPSFYDDDIKKWNERFPKQISNTNCIQKTKKGLSPGLSIADIEYKGNSMDIDHLIRKRKGAPGDLSQVLFESGLRCYDVIEEEHINNKWRFESPKDVLGRLPNVNRGSNAPIDIGRAGKSPGRYDDRIREKNANNIRHLFKGAKQISQIQWEGALRSNG